MPEKPFKSYVNCVIAQSRSYVKTCYFSFYVPSSGVVVDFEEKVTGLKQKWRRMSQVEHYPHQKNKTIQNVYIGTKIPLSLGKCIMVLTPHLFVLGCEVPCAVRDLRASVLNDLSADWNVGHSILSAVRVGRLQEREHTGGCGDRNVRINS